MRAGHTEGSVDLARLAGLKEAAVICEIINPDGTMARLARPARVLPAARPEDVYHRGPDQVSAGSASGFIRRELAVKLPTASASST